MKKPGRLVELQQPRKTVWVVNPNGDTDKIEISPNKSLDEFKYTGIVITCTTPYKLPGLIVQALAKLEIQNGNEIRMEVRP